MHFKATRPTWEQSRSGTCTREKVKFCWIPRKLDDNSWVWLESIILHQKASVTMFGNSTKWITLKKYKVSSYSKETLPKGYICDPRWFRVKQYRREHNHFWANKLIRQIMDDHGVK